MHSADKWKLRFARIFHALLAGSQRNLSDWLYLQLHDVELDPRSRAGYDLIDLFRNRELFRRWFSDIEPAPADPVAAFKEQVAGTLVLVPGFGHHLLPRRMFEEYFPMLEAAGLRVVYGHYPDSLGSTADCAADLAAAIRAQAPDSGNLVLLGYSKGAVVSLALLLNPAYHDIAARTKALVSLAGALRGSPLASSAVARATKRLLRAYRLVHDESTANRLADFAIQTSRWLPFGGLGEWGQLIKKVRDFEDDLVDLPDGIEQLSRIWCADAFADSRLSHDIKLFSLSAVYPASRFERGLAFIDNPDDLFLYVSGRELYEIDEFNDTQVMLPDSRFFAGTGDIHDLGIVKADHWGLTMPRVLSRVHEDPFPRAEMLKAVLAVLSEYFAA